MSAIVQTSLIETSSTLSAVTDSLGLGEDQKVVGMSSSPPSSPQFRHRRSSTSNSLQFTLSPSISPPVVSGSSAGRDRAFSNVSQLALSEEPVLDVGSSTSTSSYRLQTPGTPEWSWSENRAGGQSHGSAKQISASSENSGLPLLASPISSPVDESAHGGEPGSSGQANHNQPGTAPAALSSSDETSAPIIPTRPRAATNVSPSEPIPIRPGKRERSLSLSTLLRQKLQRSNTDDKPSWKTLIKKGASSQKLPSRDASASSSTTSLASPEFPLKRPSLRSRASSALNIKSRSRSNISLTLPRSDSRLEASTPFKEAPVEIAKDPVDYFALVLPRELHLLIFQNLLEIWKSEVSSSRWSGEAGGRRELIKLSRVSKTWESLVFDGQLWPDLHMTPFVHFITPGTLQRMLFYSSNFIRTLDLHGLRNLQGSHFSSALSPLGPFKFQRVDLRGCRKLGSEAVNHLLEQCSELRYLNLKGLHSVEASTLQVIARCNPLLESLNLSRCFNLSFCDLVIFLQSLQDSQITEFRIANLKGYGPTSDSLLPTIAQCLPLLEVLDLQGSPHVFDGGFRDFAAEHVKAGRRCRIKHLNLSSCTMLTGNSLLSLAPHLGDLEVLELAGYGDRVHDNSLIAVIKRAPKLRKLDLDYAKAITDAVLDALVASKEVDDEVVPSCLDTVVLSYAKGLTADGISRLIRECPTLVNLDLDNTEADTAVMHAFLERRKEAAALSLIDCHAVPAAAQMSVARAYSTRTRFGFVGYEARPFGYTATDLAKKRTVLKTPQSWKSVNSPDPWNHTLIDKAPEAAQVQNGPQRPVSQPRGTDFDEGLNCVIM